MKNKKTALLITFFLGFFGIQRFYLGQPIKGTLLLLFSWTAIPAIIAIFDFVFLFVMSNEKFNNLYNSTHKSTEKICSSCNTKISFMTRPLFGGGKLRDGNEICKNCFAIITQKDPKFILNKMRYSISDIKNLVNGKNIERKEVFDVKYKTSTSGQSEIVIDMNEEKLMPYILQQRQKKEEEIKNFKYNSNEIKQRGIQLLESIYIMHSTKSYDTLKGRFEFVNGFYDEFIKSSNNKRYLSDIQQCIDEYKTMYYDRVINTIEVDIILNPNIDKMIEFYGECLFSCFKKFYEEQKQQIEKLKTQDAKNKRLEKIISTTNLVSIELMRQCKHNLTFQEHFDYIEKIKDETYTDRYKKNGC
jgi:TM2 domain-containing membrane protein YozV